MSQLLLMFVGTAADILEFISETLPDVKQVLFKAKNGQHSPHFHIYFNVFLSVIKYFCLLPDLNENKNRIKKKKHIFSM